MKYKPPPPPKGSSVVDLNKHVAEGNGLYSPEVKGKKRGGPLHWSLDELIEYRQNGTRPHHIPDPVMLEQLGAMGVSLANAMGLFGVLPEHSTARKDCVDAWNVGRSRVGARVRASLLNDALENDNITAKIHLDKVFSGEKAGDTNIQVNVNTDTNLSEVSTEDLLNVTFTSSDDKKDDTDI